MIWDQVFTAGMFVYLALLFHTMGFLFRDELLLRSWLLIGTFFYLVYYYYISSEPLWNAIFASAVIFIVNGLLICMIILERTTFAMGPDDARLYRAFRTLTPGQFRKIMRIATWHQKDQPTVITTEGEDCDNLYYSMSGKLKISKRNRKFMATGNMFVGEIGFMMNTPASATVTVLPDTKYVSWNIHDMKKLIGKSRLLQDGLQALFNYDLAMKVSESFGEPD
ncbi:MAG: cyclic nucleotide-binding domain-containing protein [Rhizobiaceae bacterium]|nr:cyclic nucleotide-binding domain-containing protein [Rhizobiaceae bacterium]